MRKPRKAETKARQVARGNELRAWLSGQLDASKAAIARQRKADLLTGETGGGGHGVTLAMRAIKGEPPKPVNPGGFTGPNRAERRARRKRDARHFEPGPLLAGRWSGRTVWPTPPGQNTPYVRPRDTQEG